MAPWAICKPTGDDLTWWRSTPDQGLYDAMNIGLAAASGEYLIFLNAGDTLAEPGTLKTLAEHIERDVRPDFIYGDALERGADDRMLVKRATIPSPQMVRHVHSPPSHGLPP